MGTLKIKRLHIGDFGIIRNQTLDDLGPGLIVIGGPNRAGKTSFMQVLRYLGYGFPLGANLPPATHEYHVEATLLSGDELWDLLISGYGKPRVTGSKDKSVSAASLFGELDLFTYHQLFTISLDELRLLPEGVSKGEQAKLQSVLLGAGLADVARIPRLKDELDAVANKIGGKHGSPDVWMFKPYHAVIQTGVTQRDAALEQMDGYRMKVDQLAELDGSIEELKVRLQDVQQQVIRVEILLHNFSDYQAWSKLDAVLSEPLADALLTHYPEGLLEKAKALQETHEAALIDHRDKLGALRLRANGREVGEWQAVLLARANEIELAHQNLSGIMAHIETYERQLLEVQSEKRRLQSEIDTLEPSWEGDFEVIDQIITQVDPDRLYRTIEQHELLDQASSLYGRLRGIHGWDVGTQFRLYGIGSAIALLIGIIIGLWQPLLGLGVVVIGAVGLGLYLFGRSAANQEAVTSRRNVIEQLLDIARRTDWDFDPEDIDESSLRLQAGLDETQKELVSYRRILGLTEAAKAERYPARLTAVQRLYERIQSLRRRDRECEDDRDRLYSALEGLSDLISDLGYLVDAPQATAGSFNQMALVIEEIRQHLQMAKDVEAAQRRLASIEQHVQELINEEFSLGEVAVSGDGRDLAHQLQEVIQAGEKRVFYANAMHERQTLEQRMQHSLGRREIAALQAVLPDIAISKESGIEERPAGEASVPVWNRLYEEYLSRGDLEESLRRAEQDSLAIGAELEELQQARDDLHREIRALDTDQTLTQAQRAIDQARSQLEPLALQYGVYKVAALLLDTLYKQFLAEVKDTLLIRSSDLLREMTDGEYQEIQPLDQLTEAGFQVQLDGGEQLLPNALSRGTIEQLFLAVRLGRIQEIEPALPVIFDDSLVNFDPRHAHQAVQAIMGLARRHQVFVLTCHPELVDLINQVAGQEPIQYWHLDRGVFSLADGPQLIELLGLGSFGR